MIGRNFNKIHDIYSKYVTIAYRKSIMELSMYVYSIQQLCIELKYLSGMEYGIRNTDTLEKRINLVFFFYLNLRLVVWCSV